MKIPTVTGLIDRRILINYRVAPEVLASYLPAPFVPKLVQGQGMAGICLIRLKDIRPKGLPKAIGISSENGAHRIAVQWLDQGRLQQGVYIPRRDTSSRLNSLAGGRIFPGAHHLAEFQVREQDGNYQIAFKSEDGAFLSITAQETNDWDAKSLFEDLAGASDFFETGSVGYSPDKIGTAFDGLEFKTYQWTVSPLSVQEVRSSFFENDAIFPNGSVKFDNALLMRNIEHEWKSLEQIPSGKR